MTRLIDADKLCPDCMTKNGTLAISQSQIANAPTVEPTFGLFKEMLCEECGKRPTGEWKETRYETAIGITYRQTQCSNCGWKYELPMWFNFCPTCGADMRKETEE